MNRGQWLIGAGCLILFGTAIYHTSFYLGMVLDLSASDANQGILQK